MDEDFGEQILAQVPKLRAFAITLCGNRALADDLVQETVLRAWASRGKFEPGTNLGAWLHTILRNQFYSEIRKSKRMVEDPDGVYAGSLTSPPEQESRVELREMRRALAQLSPERREALILTTVGGFSYAEVAGIAGCAVGTVRSRVHRAREELVDLMDVRTDLHATPEETPAKTRTIPAEC